MSLYCKTVLFTLLFLKIVERKTKLGKFKIEGEKFAKNELNNGKALQLICILVVRIS